MKVENHPTGPPPSVDLPTDPDELELIKANQELLVTWARKGAMKGSCGKMCDDCAFRPGTEANNDPLVIDMFLNGLMWGGTGRCHKNESDGTITALKKPCVGFLYAQQHFAKK